MQETLPETIYTAESALRQFRQFVRAMGRDLLACRELAWQLAVRDIKAKYRQAWLGLTWAFLPPLATTGLFVFLSSQRLLNAGETAIPYPAFALVGTVFWQVFSESLLAPLTVVQSAKAILAKISFPREALLLSGLLQVLFGLAVRLSLVAFVFVWYHIPLPWTVVLVPFSIAALILLGFLIGLLLVPLGILYTDVSQALNIVVVFWLFITPVGYQPAASGFLARLATANPVAPLVLTARDWMTTGASDYLGSFLWVSGVCLALLTGAWVLYRVSMPIIIERMSA